MSQKLLRWQYAQLSVPKALFLTKMMMSFSVYMTTLLESFHWSIFFQTSLPNLPTFGSKFTFYTKDLKVSSKCFKEIRYSKM